MNDSRITLASEDALTVEWSPIAHRVIATDAALGVRLEMESLEIEAAGARVNLLGSAQWRDGGMLHSPLPDGREWTGRFTIARDGAALSAQIRDTLESASPLRAVGRVETQAEVLLGRLQARSEADILQIVSPTETPPFFDALYLPAKDALFHNARGYLTRAGEGAFRFDVTGMRIAENHHSTLHFNFFRRYFKEAKGLRFYEPKPLTPPSRTGWLDWYYYYGAFTEGEARANLAWLKKHVVRFGLDFFQVDMGWPSHYRRRPSGTPGTYETDWWRPNRRFAGGMRPLAGAAHKAGLEFGLWVAPWVCNDLDAFEKHPDWFLRRADGSPLCPLPGWADGFGWILDPFVPEVREHYFTGLFRMMSEQWGVDYFKLDASGIVDLTLKDYVQPGTGRKGPDIHHEAARLIRETIGPNRRILACHAPCPNMVGAADAARVGADIFIGWERGVLRTLSNAATQLWQSRFVWHADPDSLNVRPVRGDGWIRLYNGGDPAETVLNMEEARAWATAAGLTGQQITISERMMDLPEERVELLRRAIPSADVRSGDLFSHAATPPVWLLKLSQGGRQWYVVAVFNLLGNRRALQSRMAGSLDLARLGIHGPVAAYDFWARKYLGERKKTVPVRLGKRLVQVIALSPVLEHPSLVSTSRHVTQGLVDIAGVRWDEETRTLHGRSKVVRGDEYELRLHVPRAYRPLRAQPDWLTFSKGLLTVRWLPRKDGERKWHVRFAQRGRLGASHPERDGGTP